MLFIHRRAVHGIVMCRAKEAASAHKAFHSQLGDHVALLAAFRAYLNVSPAKRVSWCRRHFINHTAMRHADRIKQQLMVWTFVRACHVPATHLVW